MVREFFGFKRLGFKLGRNTKGALLAFNAFVEAEITAIENTEF
ncbi:MAG: hypothetical protein ACPG19_02895 [Saprospiraceae bacterium]